MIEHGSIANLVRGDLAEFALAPGDRVGQSSSCAFDSSVGGDLASSFRRSHAGGDGRRNRPVGARTCSPGCAANGSPSSVRLPRLLRSIGSANPKKDLPELRLVYIGGESLPQDVADRCRTVAPGEWLRPDRMHGHRPAAWIVPGKPITIGMPIPGLQAWILNEDLDEIEDGKHGELCLGGIALARGYINAPELTAQKFYLHPLLGRLYRTGDLAHRDADGNFFCHGRIDSQVKIRGYRIELEAIEAATERMRRGPHGGMSSAGRSAPSRRSSPSSFRRTAPARRVSMRSRPLCESRSPSTSSPAISGCSPNCRPA